MLERIRFMKVNRYKKFEYTPRYYDERKERIQMMQESYNKLGQQTPTEQQAYLRDRMRNAWQQNKSYSKQTRSANIRLIVILFALLFAVYYIFGSVDSFTAEVIDLETYVEPQTRN